MIVLDTCALILASDGSHDLPDHADLRVCAVTWCEIAWKHRIGKLPLAPDLAGWLAQVDALGLTTEAIDRDLFLAAVALDWDHRDPADRLIVALARRLRAPIATCDPLIRAFHPRCVW